MIKQIAKGLPALKKVSAILVIAAILVLPAGEVFAAGLLKQGSRGEEVTRLQQTLTDRGCFTHWRTTGYFGIKTRASVINFQKANGLVPDGIVGPKTNAALYGDTAASGSKAATAGSKTTTASRGAVTQEARNDLYWLARIIHAEAQGESYTGQVAVGNVIMNRVNSSEFPDSIYSVIFDSYKGIPQFSPVANGSIYNTPSASCVKAAEEAYAGSKPVGDATYFFNPQKAAGSWIVRSKQRVSTIGSHAFYR